MDLLIFLNALTAFFVIIDPIGTALIFHSLVHNQTFSIRARTALKACVISAAILVLFGNYGEPLLAKLGITIEALKISGGLLLFYSAFKMVTSTLEFSKSDQGPDIAVFPMSIPLLAGPGALTVSILLFSDTKGAGEQLSVFFAVIAISILTFLTMLFAQFVKKVIGRTGDEILRRFLGMLLAALAIQFVMDGIKGLAI